MTRRFAGLAVALLLAGAAVPAHADPATDARFTELSSAEWGWRQQQMAGGEDDDGAIQARLPDVRPETQAARLAHWRDVRRKLDAIPVASLSPAAQVDYAVYRDQIDTLIAQQEFREYEKPLNADSSFWGDFGYTARRPFTTEADYRAFIGQMNDIPRYFSEQTANMRAGLARGFTPPRVTLQGRDAPIRAVVDAKTPEDSLFYLPFKTMPASIPAATQAELRAAAVKAITDSVVPAHRTLLRFMQDEYIPKARTALAAEKMPNGKAYYQSLIKEFATLDLTPDQIHAIGLSEMAKLRTEMEAVRQQVGFKGDMPAFLHFLRTDPQFYAKTPAELLKEAAWIAKQVDDRIGKWIGHLPRQRFGVIPVPDDIAPFYTSGRGGPGIYLVNTYDLPSRALYSLRALTLHESAPGHAFQMPLANENKAQPAFRKVYISAYGEGWALYCERLGTEMGIYETPYDVFGMLSYQAWRAARLVVDTGIHAKGWTREQAQQYLRDNTALSNHEIETEVDRYIAWPGQALSYYLGEMEIMKGRAKAEAALGSKFDIRAFHDTVLELGSVPLPVLSARIDRFIADGGKGPYPDEE
ncbi:DUF885 domain-containing protein [Sphingomonas flavalba]|uniref:DUF885 domain-containing protein n=1 Tax=Sphingomonas flavalba TaxID=2559804 RepID=UPI00109DF725|nr:DUF885 family protein [Sphingomonas flavalba]